MNAEVPIESVSAEGTAVGVGFAFFGGELGEVVVADGGGGPSGGMAGRAYVYYGLARVVIVGEGGRGDGGSIADGEYVGVEVHCVY